MIVPAIFGLVFTQLALAQQQNGGQQPTDNEPFNCGFPNGTAHQLHLFNCDNGAQLVFVEGRVINDNTNATVYPLEQNQPMAIELTQINRGNPIESAHLHIRISQFGQDDDGDCGFNEIPINGLLEDIDGCALVHDCPIAQGTSSARFRLHLEPFQQVIQQLHRDNVYQLEVVITDTSNGGHHQVGCFVSQGRVD